MTEYIKIPIDPERWKVYTEKGKVRINTELSPNDFWLAVGEAKKKVRK